jgi:hypothetical protein
VIERAGRPAAFLAGGRAGLALKIGPLLTPVVSVDALFGEAATDPAAGGHLRSRRARDGRGLS